MLVHRVALRGSVSCGSGWSVPCVSIQLTLSQKWKEGRKDRFGLGGWKEREGRNPIGGKKINASGWYM